MPITSVTKDPATLTMTVVADFPVPLARLWNAYADPRQLERFWGPPTWPARFTRHDMAVGGRSSYTMTGPDGESSSGYWEFLDVRPMQSFEVRDGFAAADGSPDDALPAMRMVFAFAETAAGSQVSTTTYFTSLNDLDQLVAMGMEDGMRAAMGQMDTVLQDLATFAADLPAAAQLLDGTRVRVARVIRGTVAQVWQAHHDAALLQQWLLGPDGWTMPVCEVATTPGESYRYEWEHGQSGERFGFVGTLQEAAPPHRSVTTEQMIGMPGDPTINELTLTTVPAGTLMSLVITYPSTEVRDIVLGTGMTDGMETSYARLEDLLAAA